jgi:hypothetical protein
MSEPSCLLVKKSLCAFVLCLQTDTDEREGKGMVVETEPSQVKELEASLFHFAFHLSGIF